MTNGLQPSGTPFFWSVFFSLEEYWVSTASSQEALLYFTKIVPNVVAQVLSGAQKQPFLYTSWYFGLSKQLEQCQTRISQLGYRGTEAKQAKC